MKNAEGEHNSNGRLVAELQREHQLILHTLIKVSKLGIESPAGRVMFIAFKRQLMAHLKKEDKQVYPLLQETAKHDKTVQHTLNKLNNDMSDIKYFIKKFFIKYDKKKCPKDFGKDFIFILSVLVARIELEESTLFSIYRDLTS